MFLYNNMLFLFICFEVRRPKISDKNDKFFLYYRHLFWGALFIRTQCDSYNRILESENQLSRLLAVSVQCMT